METSLQMESEVKKEETGEKNLFSFWIRGEGAPLPKQHDLSKPRQRHRHQAQGPGQLDATAKTKTHFQHARNKTPNQQTTPKQAHPDRSRQKRTDLRPVGASVREDFMQIDIGFRIGPVEQYIRFQIKFNLEDEKKKKHNSMRVHSKNEGKQER